MRIIALAILMLLTHALDAAAQTAWTQCAVEWGTCQFLGRKIVRYGGNGTYFSGVYENGVECNNDTFGDPIYGVVKSCQYANLDDTSTPPPVNTVTKVPTSGSVWTNGVVAWAGAPECLDAGLLPASTSGAIDAGALVAGHHCPKPGLDASGCKEWFGAAPDIGACEPMPRGPGTPPMGTLTMKVIP